MKYTVPALLLAVMVGYIAGWLNSRPASVLQTPAREQAQAQTDERPLPPEIPPVPNPPLYPDPPNRAMHWSLDELRRIYAARLAAVGNSTASASPPAASFQGQSFRTHRIGASFRVQGAVAQLSNRAGVLSLLDDADQHEGVTDFYVLLGGSGQIVTDGVIENRVHGSTPRSATRTGAKVTNIFGGEFNGQPIRDGNTHDVKAGDWLAIPPNVPHWPGFNAGEGLMYVMVKINIGLYPPNLMY